MSGPEHDDALSLSARGGRLRGRLRGARADRMLQNSAYIMATTIVTSAFGFVFWVIAAHAFSAANVGRSATLVSAMLLVAIVTTLGLGQVYISRLATRAAGPDWSLTVTVGLVAVLIVSLVGGAIAAGVLPLLVPRLRHGIALGAWLLLPFGIAGAAVSMVLDQACLAMRLARPAFWRNAYMAVLRAVALAFALIASVSAPTWVMLAWTVTLLVFDVTGIVRTIPSLHPEFRPTLRGWRAELSEMRGLMAGHQSINLSAQAATLLLPVVVAARSGPTLDAYFYTTWMLANALFLISPSISNALFAEGAHAPDNLHSDMRRAIRYMLALGIPVAVALLLLGRPVLGIFGHAYASHGMRLLEVLILAAVFDAGLSVCVAVLRVRRGLAAAASATSVALVVGLIGTWFFLPAAGLAGAGIGWAIGRAAGMLLAVWFVARSSAENPASSARSVSEVLS